MFLNQLTFFSFTIILDVPHWLQCFKMFLHFTVIGMGVYVWRKHGWNCRDLKNNKLTCIVDIFFIKNNSSKHFYNVNREQALGFKNTIFRWWKYSELSMGFYWLWNVSCMRVMLVVGNNSDSFKNIVLPHFARCVT